MPDGGLPPPGVPILGSPPCDGLWSCVGRLAPLGLGLSTFCHWPFPWNCCHWPPARRKTCGLPFATPPVADAAPSPLGDADSRHAPGPGRATVDPAWAASGAPLLIVCCGPPSGGGLGLGAR